MNKFEYRQGDVGFTRVEALPENAKPKRRQRGRIVLAEGEVTGHAHAITDTAVTWHGVDGSPLQWVVVPDAPAEVTHEEHNTVVLPPGVYVVDIQRQYQRGEITRVLD